MTISLIASTLGRQDVLSRLLTSLAAQSFTDFEIIVVDQNPKVISMISSPSTRKTSG
ncbi:MAG: glycosyltransferase family 2 protein [Allorhizobium sp.]